VFTLVNRAQITVMVISHFHFR